MTTTSAPAPAGDGGTGPSNGPPTLSSITRLPALPNPANGRGPVMAGLVSEGLRVMQTLGENAANGAVDYPYPTNSEYPLPPLPPIPVPTAALRRRQRAAEARTRAPEPIAVPPIPPSSPLAGHISLDAAVAAHNAAHPDMPAALHCTRSALLVRLRDRGFLWCLVRTLGADDDTDAHTLQLLGVRCFLGRDARPPPIHAVPPPGPSQVLATHLKSLDLNVPALLFRLPHEVDLMDTPCYRCGKFLSDVDGLPLGETGWIPPAPRKSSADSDKVVNGKAGKEEKDKDAMDVDGEEKKGGEAAKSKEADGAKDGAAPNGESAADAHAEGRWVAWHESCRAP